jgi:glycosyltransferase involved in cell wall biosynthesis
MLGEMRIVVLCNRRSDGTNAIEDASVELVAALRASGAEAELALHRDGSWIDPEGQPLDVDAAIGGADAVVVQYQPFLWGRRGFAPWLPRFVVRIRKQHNARIVLVIHEPFLEFGGPTKTALALWQRGQLAALRVSSDIVCAAIEPWVDQLRRNLPLRRTAHLPVGSNLPDRSSERGRVRERLGLSDEDFVLTVFGTDHPSRLWEYCDAALAQIAALRRVTVLSLGAGNRFPVNAPPGVRVERPGFLPAEEVAELISASDLVLSPFTDGVSSRRGSAMAAFQHGVAVVATSGHLTDPTLLATDGLALVPVGDPDAFADTAARLARDEKARRTAAEAGHALYLREYDWPRIAERLLDLLERPLKVVVTVPWGERAGGAEMILWSFMQHLDRKAVDLVLVLLQTGSFAAEAEERGFRVYTIASGRLRRPTRFAVTVRTLARIIRAEQPDLLLDWSAKTHMYGGIAAAYLGISSRTLWWQQGISQGGWLDRVATLLPSTAIGCYSQPAAVAQRRIRPARRMLLVHPGSDEPSTTTGNVREQLGIEADGFVVGCVARMHPEKRQELVLEAVADLRARGIAAYAAIVGGPILGVGEDYEHRLRRRAAQLEIESFTIFTGQVDDPADYIRAMDVVVSASARESFGVTVIEAMSVARPVVAFAGSGGPDEILAHGETGLLVQGRGAGALADALEELARDSSLRARLGENGRAVFEQKYRAGEATRVFENTLRGIDRRVTVDG